MDKIVELGEHFANTGEPTAQLVAFSNGRGGLSMEKTALASAQSPLYDFLQTIQAEPGVYYILVNALGSWEYYDDNRNGDGFPAMPYKVGQPASCGHPDCSNPAGWIAEPETLLHHYKSFEKHGGIYLHHKNSDPTKSLGDVRNAVWNPYMRRVELLLKGYNDRDARMAQRIGDGDFPAVSMGARVRWDVCTICGHRAPTRADYCVHAATMLRKVLPDGRKCSVLNPSPLFFDISFVFRPADPTGYMLQKVAETIVISSAELGERRAEHQERVRRAEQERSKFAELTRSPYRREADVIAREWPSLAGATREVLASVPVATALSSLAYAGVVLGAHEVTDLFATRMGHTVTAEWLDRVAAIQPVLQTICDMHPMLEEKLGGAIQLRIDAVNGEPLNKIGEWIEKRGGLGHYLRQQAFAPSDFDLPIGPGAWHRATEPAKTDVFTMTDPATGQQYQTTRGAAMGAHNEDVKSQLAGTALMGTLYAGGLRAMLGHRAGLWALPASAAAGWATTKAMKKMFPPHRYHEYGTDQGIPVSGGTEFMKVSTLVQRAAFDEQAADRARAHGGPFATWLGMPESQKLASLLEGAIGAPEELYGPPTLDLTVLCQNIAAVLWR